MKPEIEVCKTLVIHEELVLKAQHNMPDEYMIRRTGDFFKVLGEPTRIKIINALFYSEMCVCDIAAVMNMKQSAVSHQLKILKQANLVRYRKDGKIVYYSLCDEHVKLVYEQGMLHVSDRIGESL